MGTEQDGLVAPLPGPAPLADKQRLWGRGSDIDSLSNLLGPCNVVVLTGRSGIGKTSLLFAQDGLAAKLADRFTVLRLQPAYRLAPFLRTQSALPTAAPVPLLLPVGASDMTLAQVPDGVRRLWDTAAGASVQRPRPPLPMLKPPLLLIDRIEDLLGADAPPRQAVEGLFVRLERLTAEENGLRILLIVQEEYLIPLERYRSSFTDKLQARHPLGSLGEAVVRGGVRAELATLSGQAAILQDEQVTQLISDSAGGAAIDLRTLRSGLFTLWSLHHQPTLRQKAAARIARFLQRRSARNRRPPPVALSYQAITVSQLVYLQTWLGHKVTVTDPEDRSRLSQQITTLLVRHYVDARGRRTWCRRSTIKKSKLCGQSLDTILDELYRAGVILRYPLSANEYAFLLAEDITRQIVDYSRHNRQLVRSWIYNFSGASLSLLLFLVLTVFSYLLHVQHDVDQGKIASLNGERVELISQRDKYRQKMIAHASCLTALDTCLVDSKKQADEWNNLTEQLNTANQKQVACQATVKKLSRCPKPNLWTLLQELWFSLVRPDPKERSKPGK